MCVFLNVWKVLMLNSLKDKDIPSVSYYTVPLQLQPVFKHLGYQAGNFPVTDKVANQCFSLPMSPYLTQEVQSLVIGAIRGKDLLKF